VDKAALFGLWLHAFEEDADGALVYRPEGYKLPLARGRGSLDLARKSVGGIRTAGAADRAESVTTHWRLSGNVLEFSTDGGRSFKPMFEVLSLERDRLKVRKL
jgi:photosystem II stability/assembly factor-like uncharacterized protein